MENDTLGGIVVILLLAGAFFGWLFFLAPIEYPEPLTQPAQTETSIPSSVTSTSKFNGEDLLDLRGAILYTGTEFVLTNSDSFHWVNVELDLNGGLWTSGYVYTVARIPPGTWHIDATNFVKKGGEMFNPFTHRPQSMSITTKNSAGIMTGFASRKW